MFVWCFIFFGLGVVYSLVLPSPIAVVAVMFTSHLDSLFVYLFAEHTGWSPNGGPINTPR